MQRTTIVAALVAASLIGTRGLSATEAVSPGPPTVNATAIGSPPSLDGDVLNDPAWAGVTPTSGFTQKTPDEGRPASERTEVYIAYTGDTLFFGVVCYDRDPSRIIVADSRRDSELVETDSFQIILDTYRDQQTGFVFGTNPVGIEYDGQVTREGEGGLFSAGGFNKNWNGVWEVSASISDIGWSAEFAIPFTTLRYPRDESQIWALNMQRNIRHRNEQSFWSKIPVQFEIYRLSLAGSMTGLQVPRQRNLQLLPYVLGETWQSETEGAATDNDFEFGLDLKYSLTPSLTLDATYNTDFAQVEADEFQVNLDRFNVFFPEKRPFFLENAGSFSVGVPEEVELFFSRRIGIGPDGEVIPIMGGARVSGKLAERYNVGGLFMRTEGVPEITRENSFGVARLSRDLPNRSYIGGIVVSRRGQGGPGVDEDFNHTFGVDGRWGIGDYGLLQGFVARAETPETNGRQHAFRLGGKFDSERWSLSGDYTEVGDDFNPEVGFLTRRGYRKPAVALLRRIRPETGALLEIRPHFSYRGFWDFDGFQESGFLHVDNHLEWRSSYELHTGVNFTREGVKEQFEIYPGIQVSPGTYDNAEASLVLISNQGAPAAFEMRTVFGGFFGGDRLALTPQFRFRVGDTLNAEFSWSYNDIDLPEGAFETNLGRLRVTYSFATLISLQALIQYNDRADVWAANLRFAWLRTANSGLYVVYNEIQDLYGDLDLMTQTRAANRSLTLKYTYLFDVLK